MSDDECEDRTGFVMRCHYEVLGIDRKATDPEIRRAYKMSALRCHPDKNYNRLEEADAEFKEVQGSYSVLIDPDERAWYDSHRISILRGGDGSSAPDEINLFSFMNAKCYSGFGDNAEGFFGVYNKVFNTIVKEESDYSDKILKEAPKLGSSDTEYKDGVSAFYIYWKNFSTFKNFAWKEEFKVSDMPDRWHRREAEKANAKERNNARREYVAMVQQLAIFIYNRDPRVAKEKERLEEEKLLKEEEKAKKADEASKRRREANKKLWAEIAEKEAKDEEERAARGDELDGSTLEVLYEKQRQMEALRKKGGAMRSSAGGNAGEFAHLDMLPGEGDAEAGVVVEEADDFYKCLACKKTFRTDKMWAEHVKSGKHKTKIKTLEKQGVDVSTMLITPGGATEEKGATADADESDDDEEEDTKKPSSSAPKKKGGATSSSSAAKKEASEESDDEEPATTMAPKKGKAKKGKKMQHTTPSSEVAAGGKCDTLDPDFLLKLAQNAVAAADEKGAGKKKGKKGKKGPSEAPPKKKAEVKTETKKKRGGPPSSSSSSNSDDDASDDEEPVRGAPRNAFASLRK